MKQYYMLEKVADRGEEIELAKREFVDRERWRLLCRGHPLRGRSWREQGIRDVIRT